MQYPRPGTLEAATLIKAVVRAAEEFSIDNTTLARIIGASVSDIARIRITYLTLPCDEKILELATLFYSACRDLNILSNGDGLVARSWLTGKNIALNDTPLDLIQTVTGLVDVARYLTRTQGK